MRMRNYDVHGNLLGGRVGKRPNANIVQDLPINMAGFSNPEIYRVEVAMQVLVGTTWTVVGTPVTVYI